MAHEPKPKPVRSRGAVALARTGLTQEQIAQRLGRPQPNIALLVSGKRRPRKGGELRAEMATEFGIEPDWWDEPATAGSAPVNGKPSVPAGSEDMSVRARALRIQRQLDQLLQGIADDKQATPLEKAKVYASAAATAGLLGKITGETQDIGESRIVRLPAWRRLEDQMVEALRPWPEAARAIAATLRKFGETQ